MLSTEELLLINCGAGEDSWESLGLQGDVTSPSERKSVLDIHWKDWCWCWCWSSNTLATWCKEVTYQKRHWCWERLKAGGEEDYRGWDGWMASLTWWTWVWASSRSWWSTEVQRAAVHEVRKSQTQLRDWTELKWGRTRILSQGCTTVSWLLLPCFLHPLSSLISNCLNLSFRTQGRSWRLETVPYKQWVGTWTQKHLFLWNHTGSCLVSVQDTKDRYW